MLMRWLFVCWCVLLACGSANLAEARGGRIAVEAQRLPVLGSTLSAWGKLIHSLGRGVLVIGTSLLLICGQMGCGGDEADETETVITKVVAAEKSSEDTLDGSSFKMADYLDKYIIYVSDGDGSLSTGYVVKLRGGKLVLRSIEEDDDFLPWQEPEDKEEMIGLQAVVGVMHRTHALIDEEVSFKRIHGAMRFPNRKLPDTIFGTVDVVYVEALLPAGSGEATAVGVTVHSGLFHNDLHWVRLQLPATIYLPIGRVDFREVPKDAPPPNRKGEKDPNKDPNEDEDLVDLDD